MSNHKSVVDSFRPVYGINRGIAQGKAVAIGRYTEDVYYNGNPWYLATLAAAEQLYDAIIVWKQQGSITVTSLSLTFFRDLIPSISTGTYSASSSTFTSIVDAVRAFADGFVSIIDARKHSDGSMPEQFHRDTGTPLAAADLTWSYSAFLTAAARRAGKVPPSWVAAGANALNPNSCGNLAIAGIYSSATNTNFPSSQTPGSGTTPTSTGTGTVPTPTGGCSEVLVTFNGRVATQWGQTVKLVGNQPALGNWNPNNGVTLSSSAYTSSDPLWSITVALPAGASVQYKFVKVDESDGTNTVRWESDPNRSFTVPSTSTSTSTSTCDDIITREDTWR